MAKEYIEREVAIRVAKEPSIYDLTDVPEWLSYLPAADVVEVVRCRDCVYWHLSGKPPFMFYTCTVAEGLNVCKGDSFCSYGERRDDNAQTD